MLFLVKACDTSEVSRAPGVAYLSFFPCPGSFDTHRWNDNLKHATSTSHRAMSPGAADCWKDKVKPATSTSVFSSQAKNMRCSWRGWRGPGAGLREMAPWAAAAHLSPWETDACHGPKSVFSCVSLGLSTDLVARQVPFWLLQVPRCRGGWFACLPGGLL